MYKIFITLNFVDKKSTGFIKKQKFYKKTGRKFPKYGNLTKNCGLWIKQTVDKKKNICYTLSMYLEIIEQFGEKFKVFKDLLSEYNSKYNLTAISDEKEVYIKHFYDSIAPEKYFFENARVIEIGSGGGFPSVPLKIIRDDLKFTLIESTGKKCAFLNAVVDKLKLDGVKVMNIRAEDGGRDGTLREKFDIATARAVARLNVLCEYCLPFVKVGGRFIAYKGDAEEEIKESKNALNTLGGEIEDIFYYDLPEGYGKRTAVIIKKIRTAPDKYPRGNGLERKKPL